LGRKFWLEITQFDLVADLPHVTVTAASTDRATVHTRAVGAFCLHETAHLDRRRATTVAVDDQVIEVQPQVALCFSKSHGVWGLDSPSPTTFRKRPFLEGPWSDLLAEPLVVVYGSQNQKTVELNRYVATRLFEPKYGVKLRIPVVSDEQYATRAFAQPRAVYVGRPDDHLQLSRIASQLPIRVNAQRIELADAHFDEPDVGAVFVYPDPERRERLLGVVTANGPEGLLRALSLPMLVPDFMVFDRGIDAASADPVLGPLAFVRAAGFFQSDWSLPANFDDPVGNGRSR
jgi:hypothetical protein